MAYTKAEKEGLVPLSRTGNQDITVEINSQYLDYERLITELSQTYLKPQMAQGIISNWFSRRKIESQDRKLAALLSLVKNIREHSTSLIDFKEHLISRQMEIHYFLIGKKQQLEFEITEAQEANQTVIATHQSEALKRQYEAEALRLENEWKKMLIDQQKYQNRLMELRGNMLARLIDEINLQDIDLKLVMMLEQLIKDYEPKGNILTVEGQYDKLKAEALGITMEAERKRHEAEAEKLETKHKEHKYGEIWKKDTD